MIGSMRFGRRIGVLMLAVAAGTGVAQSQTLSSANRSAGEQQASSGDSLSRHLRELANNPRSVAALTGAGQSALDLGDSEAALGFFARAEELAPRDGRVKAGIGSALVMMEQADSALRFFGEARAFGVPEAEYAGDRGLAYDLTGNSRLAQKDYQMALRRRDDPEIRRRLALSLAISGDREAALAAIDALVRQQDRAAWRTRAFVLALSGDAAGAAKVVQAMMPGQADALQPFLARLPSLSPADRALAVNFGHFPGNGQGGPLAASTAAPPPVPFDQGRPDAGQRPIGVGGVGGAPVTSTPQVPKAAEVRRETPRAAPVLQDRPTPTTSSPTVPVRAAQAVPSPSVVREAAPASQATTLSSLASPATPLPSQIVSDRPPTLQGGSQVAAPGPDSPGITISPTTAGQSPSDLVNAPPESGALAQLIASSPTAGSSVAVASLPGPSPQAGTSGFMSSDQSRADSGTARIAGFADVAALVAALPANVRETREPADPSEPASPASSSTPNSPASPKSSSVNLTPAKKSSGRSGEATTKGTEDPKAAAKTAVAMKAEAAKKAAAVKKAEAAKKEPSRIWVQVAHGPTLASLSLALNRVRKKGPKLFADRSAWTTTFDRTNRLLIGPFKSSKEAAAFVSQLDKADIISFAWTSAAGQEISKLPGK